MAFQDFDQISERRRLERQRKFRKRVTIGVVSALAFVVIIAAGIGVAVSSNNHKQQSREDSKGTEHKETSNVVSRMQKVIKTVCNSTTYKSTCETTLDKAVKKNSTVQPTELLKFAIEAIDGEVEKVLNKISTFKFSSPREQAAFEDCRELIENAREELKESINNAAKTGVSKITKDAPNLNNWLSAIMSYHQTCIDGFPEGKLKTDIEKAYNATKELTSNSLAIVNSLSSILSTFDLSGLTSRHLLALDHDGLPTWMNHEDRRILKGANQDKPTPNVTVAQDGSGQFTTISAALAAMPAKYTGRYIIYVKAGVYDETVTVTKNMVNVTMYGDGSQKSIVTGNKNFVDGVQTFRTATFVVSGDGFLAKAMGFRNTAGPEKHQAVAVRAQADRVVFLNCRFEGYQDTLYAQAHRQFYKSCVISGTVDFIFGDAAAIFQNCLITVRKPLDNQQNIVTAQGRIDPHETTGIVLHNCRVEAAEDLLPVKATIRSYLGRPWKEYSRTIIMESTINDFIHPDGWLPWEGDFGLKTLYYAEYNNKGAGASTTARVKWPGYHVVDKQEALKYTVEPFLQGGDWIPATGSPLKIGMFN